MKLPAPARAPPGFLSQMAQSVREEIEAGFYSARPETTLSFLLRPPRLSVAIVACPYTPAVIGELKHRSPGYADVSLPDLGPEEFVEAARDAGLDALSVIPQPQRFEGSLEEFGMVTRSTSLPVLFKDFILAEEQIECAAAWGASAVLLIARLDEMGATQVPLDELVDIAHDHELDALVEIHSASEIPLAEEASPDLIGVNARDLETLEISTYRATQLIAELREIGVPVVGMSGISDPSTAQDYAAAGASAILVGTEFVRSSDRAGFIAGLRRGGPA